MGMRARTRVSTSPTVTTHIIVTTNLLTLSNEELEAVVETELAENPALEMVPCQRCQRCGRLIERPPCLHCVRELLTGLSVPVEWGYQPGARAGTDSAEDDFDPLQMVAEPTRLADHVLSQLRPQLGPAAVPVADLLAEALDERGFLTVPVHQIAHWLRAPKALVEGVLQKMQSVDPVGVGSRDEQECLLRQLEALERQGHADPILPMAHRIVNEFWEAFLHNRWSEIPIGAQQLSEVHAFLHDNLTPYPALSGWEDHSNRRQGPVDRTHYSRPDMAIYVDGEGKLAVEIFSIQPSWLRLSSSFRAMLQSAEGERKNEWVEMAESARLFIKCLGQRQQTLRRAVERLVTYQEKAIREGDAYIRQLTRTQLARELDVHEATVSRAVMGKTAALPDGRIVPLSHFFESGKSAKELIRQMIEEEEHPLSDTELVVRLKSMGQSIARRTVAKYRNMQGILPAHLRARQRSACRQSN